MISRAGYKFHEFFTSIRRQIGIEIPIPPVVFRALTVLLFARPGFFEVWNSK